MGRKIMLIMSVVAMLWGCDAHKKEQAKLNQTIDSLTMELATNHKMSKTLEEVGALIDSIDRNRNLLRTSMMEGTSMDDFQSRMRDINAYVKTTVRKIDELEKSLKTSKASGSQYASALKKLKADLESRNTELAELKQKIEQYSNENDNLIQTVNLQRAEIEDKLKLISQKEEATAQLEDEIRKMLIQSKLDEAESYYAQALALEEAAKRTKFAPRKKKTTNQQALEMYELAVLYGKEEATAKVAMLKKKI